VALTDEQAEALMRGAITDQDVRTWLFVSFGLNTAMRHREILRVRYDQIDFANRRIFIPDAKAGEREQPITKALAEALTKQRKMEKQKEQDGWVFPTANPKQANAGHRTNMARQFARAVVRAGLDPDKVTPHTMRRTAITRLVKAGVDLPTIQRISGHKTLSMVMRYVNVHGAHIDAGIANLDTAFAGVVTPGLHTPALPEAPEGASIVAITASKSAA
jgi:integrase